MDQRDDIEMRRLQRDCTPGSCDAFRDQADYNSQYKTHDLARTANMGTQVMSVYRFFTEEARDKALAHVRACKDRAGREWGL